tara:strand:- start:5217 stop:5648 length:432 start_codon:yes stop_codon:yes gene_type:complete
MSLKTHIESLQKQHLAADKAVKEHDVPGVCSTMVRGLKLRRLQLKKDLVRLGADTITKDRHNDGPDVDALRTQLNVASSGGRHQTSGQVRERLEAEIAAAEGIDSDSRLTSIDGGDEFETVLPTPVAGAAVPTSTEETAAHAA